MWHFLSSKCYTCLSKGFIRTGSLNNEWCQYSVTKITISIVLVCFSFENGTNLFIEIEFYDLSTRRSKNIPSNKIFSQRASQNTNWFLAFNFLLVVQLKIQKYKRFVLPTTLFFCIEDAYQTSVFDQLLTNVLYSFLLLVKILLFQIMDRYVGSSDTPCLATLALHIFTVEMC